MDLRNISPIDLMAYHLFIEELMDDLKEGSPEILRLRKKLEKIDQEMLNRVDSI